jgi:hypothetical protein
MTMTDDDTEVVLTQAAPEQSTAWSDYADDDERLASTEVNRYNDDRHTWLVPSVCVAMAALAVVVLSVVWSIVAHSARGSAVSTARIAPSSGVVTSTVTAMPAPPPVTVTEAPTPPVTVTEAPGPTWTLAPSAPVPEDKDSQYLSLLHKYGFGSSESNIDTQLKIAHQVCLNREQGLSTEDNVRALVNNPPRAPHPEPQLTYLVHTAINIYCPQYGP